MGSAGTGTQAAVLSCKTVVMEQKAEILPVEKKTQGGGCHLNVITQPRLSIQTAASSHKSQQFMSALNHMERRKVSAVMTALVVPSGATQILKDIWALLTGAPRLKQAKREGKIKGK